jgi:hypothetical protein
MTGRRPARSSARRLRSHAATVVAVGVIAASMVSAPARPMPTAVPVANLCVTEGSIESSSPVRAVVKVPKMRAYLNRPSSDPAELRVTFLGATTSEARLGSGAWREQFGLKLRAADPCNLLYVMWRLKPRSELVVSIKQNPGQRTSAECGNHGYRNLKPRFHAALPELAPGGSHRLRAETDAESLKAFVDERLVWEGPLEAASSLSGPVGLRTDNVQLEFELSAENAATVQSGPRPGCRRGPEESE